MDFLDLYANLVYSQESQGTLKMVGSTHTSLHLWLSWIFSSVGKLSKAPEDVVQTKGLILGS